MHILRVMLANYSFHGVLGQMWGAQPVHYISTTPCGDLQLRLVTYIPNRDSAELMEFIAVHHFNPLWTPEEMREEFETWLLEIWKHEFWEGLQYNGKRVKEQH